jgi:hypothetical protein
MNLSTHKSKAVFGHKATKGSVATQRCYTTGYTANKRSVAIYSISIVHNDSRQYQQIDFAEKTRSESYKKLNRKIGNR